MLLLLESGSVYREARKWMMKLGNNYCICRQI